MRSEPMTHQRTGVQLLSAHPEYYALGCEQGTGKTWMLLADAERQFLSGRITGLLVIAPKGVHTNWIRREIPRHMSVSHVAEEWVSGGGVARTRRLERLLKVDCETALPICAMNVDAVNTTAGREYAQRFLRTFKTMMVVDESQRIKNPSAKRTKRILALGQLAVSRRISSGTLVADSPVDLYSQFEFLAPGLLGTTSYRAFVAEYSELLPAHHPLVAHIKTTRRGTPQIVRKDAMGQPVYRNLDKLSALLAPHTYRVTKEECLDLPQKIYQIVFFDLLPAQRRLYNQVKRDVAWQRDDGDIDAFTALTLITKLQQITSGFILVDGEPTELVSSAPRLAALKEIVEDSPGQIIVWARFRAELAQIADELHEYGVVEYHGGVSDKDRAKAIDAFQSGAARIFVANPASGGTGLSLHVASTVVYYSCSYSLEERSQSEDRAHRIGTRRPVVYIDLVASDTIDERVANALQTKALVANEILNAL